MADLKGIGRILGVLGGIIMVVFAIIIVISNVASELLEAMADLVDLTTINLAGQALGTQAWIISAAITLVCGLIAIFGYQKLTSRDKGDLILWGIIYIVIGLVGGTVGGLIVLIGGIVLIIDYFI
ncbi:MAG: hypothetical protein ACFFAE_21795 [Candidatus Hodarchaeota archaeon]